MTSRSISIMLVAGAMGLAAAAPAVAMTLPPDSVILPTSIYHRPSVDFGSHDLSAAPVVRQVVIFNAGSTPLSLPAPTVERPSVLRGPEPDVFSLVGETCFQWPLQPEATCTATIRLTPSLSTSPRGNGSVISNLIVRPAGAPVTTVRLGARVLHPSFLSPMVRPPLKLGWVRPGRASAPRQMTLQVIGGYDLVPGALTLGGPDADQFRISGNRCSGVPLKPHARCTYDVTFAPTSSGRKTAVVTVAGTRASREALAVEGTGLPTVGATLRVLARRAGYLIAGPKLAGLLSKRRFSLGLHSWPVAGKLQARVEVVTPSGRRLLAESQPTPVLGTGREPVMVKVRRAHWAS